MRIAELPALGFEHHTGQQSHGRNLSDDAEVYSHLQVGTKEQNVTKCIARSEGLTTRTGRMFASRNNSSKLELTDWHVVFRLSSQ